MELKQCLDRAGKSCQKYLPLSGFYFHKGKPLGVCKQCFNKRAEGYNSKPKPLPKIVTKQDEQAIAKSVEIVETELAKLRELMHPERWKLYAIRVHELVSLTTKQWNWVQMTQRDA